MFNKNNTNTQSNLTIKIITAMVLACLLTISCGFLLSGQATGGMAKSQSELDFYSNLAKKNTSNKESGLYKVPVFIPASVELPESKTLQVSLLRNYTQKDIALSIGQAISDSGFICKSEQTIKTKSERHCKNLVQESDLSTICPTYNSCGLAFIQESNTISNGENINVNIANLK
jgi:hypothetical protein